MEKYLLVTADTNDGDYISDFNLITDEQLEEIKPVIEAISNVDRAVNWCNWPDSENLDETPYMTYDGILTEEQITTFRHFTPYGEYGIHSIENVHVIQIIDTLL